MLDNVEFNSYILNTIAFARTVVIKCEQLALLDNKLLSQYYKIDAGVDKTKWKYYLNLNGEYHATDDVMEIQSLDNRETIRFTKENLELHLATKRAYRLGSYYYTRLVDKYPHQLTLINGIINPIPQSESISANDYQILRYNPDYVLWNEYQLIPALQEELYKLAERPFKTEYLLTDNLMLTALLTYLHGFMLISILQIREDNDGTRYAHEFYIWSKLRSLGFSTIYKDVLDNKQTMWLYRNLESVLRKLGQKQTFEKLTDIILTHRMIPLTRYETVQTTETMLETLEVTPQLISKPVNLIKEFGLSNRLFSVTDVVNKEVPLALDNNEDLQNAIAATDYAIKYSLQSEVPSKILESQLNDITDLNPDSIIKVLHNNWIYLTFKGLYTINIDVSDIRNGKHIKLSTSDALVLWHYLMARAQGVDHPDKIPEYIYWKARKIVPPTYKDLMKLGHQDILTEKLCKDILRVHIDFPRLISPDTFFQKCREIFDGIWKHKKLYSRVTNLFYTTRVQNATDACYETGFAKVTNTETYDRFLLEKDLDYLDYTKEECLTFAWQIWEKVTGWEYNSFMSVSEQQRLLLNVMKDLTSYTVQYVGTTASEGNEYLLPYQPLMDGDHWDSDGKTALESDGQGLILISSQKGIPEASLSANELTFSVDKPPHGTVEAISMGSGCIYMPMNLYPIESEPDVSVNIIPNRMTLKEAL